MLLTGTSPFFSLLSADVTKPPSEDRRTVEDTKGSVVESANLTPPDFRVPGPFQPTYESLKAYKCPEWYQDAKFGMWAHWGPQGVAGIGDWYARNMYVEGSGTYKYHLEHYGHPSKFGYKDIIQLWKAEKFDPDRLIKLYKAAGAKYFVSMGCHHDNFDLWNSKFHRWNAAAMGPHKDIVGLWRAAAIKQGLRFGVSEHMAPSFKWFSVTHNADTNGPLAGIPYDGNDPTNYDLYGPKPERIWSAGAELWRESNMPDSWKEEWFNRCNDLLATYKPDYVYSDYGNVPFRHEVGWQLLANYYNRSIEDHSGKLEAVYTGKGDKQRVYVRDFESGGAGGIQPEPWQMDWCIANFFYDSRRTIRTSATVIRLLSDVVSKNGNLLLSIPQRPDGSLDDQTENFMKEMADWMKVNGEAIFATRPFKIYGEGPTIISDFRKPDLPYTPEDIRFTTKGEILYAITLGIPSGREVLISTLGKNAPFVTGEITRIELLGHPAELTWSRDQKGLMIHLSEGDLGKAALVFRISGLKDLGFDGLTYPAPNGVFSLQAGSAELHGEHFSLSKDGKGGASHVSGWMDPAGWLSWKVKILHPGSYEVLMQSSAAGGESQFSIRVGESELNGKFPATKDWDDAPQVSLGTLSIPKAGSATVELRPSATSWKALNFVSLTLRPITN